jgi:hypothetical protein
MEEKKRFLDEAKVRNATLIFFHDAYSRMEQVKP